VSEGWLRLANAKFSVENRQHFIAMIARAMRFVLVDESRKEMAEKRADGVKAVSLDESIDAARDDDLFEIIAMDAALTRLERLDARLAGLVEMRYFGGLDEADIAMALGVTERTLRRDWRKARAFLLTHLGERPSEILAHPLSE
jgi:RNA polymerase sigma factor (TIGR02999 family)